MRFSPSCKESNSQWGLFRGFKVKWPKSPVVASLPYEAPSLSVMADWTGMDACPWPDTDWDSRPQYRALPEGRAPSPPSTFSFEVWPLCLTHMRTMVRDSNHERASRPLHVLLAPSKRLGKAETRGQFLHMPCGPTVTSTVRRATAAPSGVPNPLQAPSEGVGAQGCLCAGRQPRRDHRFS